MAPRTVPFRDVAEFLSIKSAFDSAIHEQFGSAAVLSTDEILSALDTVTSWELRGNAPVSSVLTANLISARMVKSNQARRLALAAALVRFVNLLLDPLQNGQYALPLYILADQIALPARFVDVRHACTHENLPGLEILESSAKEAILYLKDHYWEPELRRLNSVDTELALQIQGFTANAPLETLVASVGGGSLYNNIKSEDQSLLLLRSTLTDYDVPISDDLLVRLSTAELVKLANEKPNKEERQHWYLTIFGYFAHDMSTLNRLPDSATSIKRLSPVLKDVAAKVQRGFVVYCLQVVLADPVGYSAFTSHTPKILQGQYSIRVHHALDWIRELVNARDSKSGEPVFHISITTFLGLTSTLKLAPCQAIRKLILRDPADKTEKLFLQTYEEQVNSLSQLDVNSDDPREVIPISESIGESSHQQSVDETLNNISRISSKLDDFISHRSKRVKTSASSAQNWELVPESEWSTRPIGIF
ncbi:Las1-like-domain-containing protein [Lipomyces oligophaga]|uniref:Las1-like-domain-containing protein n=1 Tax=Lipomyces oligophaga TaxID=45792 RepID=UPI0034CDAB45